MSMFGCGLGWFVGGLGCFNGPCFMKISPFLKIWSSCLVTASQINLQKLFDSLDTDIICLQETKVTRTCMLIFPFCNLYQENYPICKHTSEIWHFPRPIS